MARDPQACVLRAHLPSAPDRSRGGRSVGSGRPRRGLLHAHDLRGFSACTTICRRLDDDFIDRLECRPDSLLGVPGLVRAYRAGTLAIANAFGAGVTDRANRGRRRTTRTRYVDLHRFAVFGKEIGIVPGGLTREGSTIVNSFQGGGSKNTCVLDDDTATDVVVPRTLPFGRAQQHPTYPTASGTTNDNNSSSKPPRTRPPSLMIFAVGVGGGHGYSDSVEIELTEEERA